jgi:CheY-like chemotaxis protein
MNSNQPVSILLVDDDEINNFISIKLIKKALLTSDIMACLNGRFAIDQLVDIQKRDPEKLPDYIFLDINMPIKAKYLLSLLLFSVTISIGQDHILS